MSLMCHRKNKTKENNQTEESWLKRSFAGWALVIPSLQLPHQGSAASLRTRWRFLRKMVKPQNYRRLLPPSVRKAGTRLPRPARRWASLTAFSRTQQHRLNVVIWEHVQSSAFQGGSFRYPEPLRVNLKKRSAWWTGIEPALLRTAGVIWVRIDLVRRKIKRGRDYIWFFLFKNERICENSNDWMNVAAYLRIQRGGLEAELVNVGQKRAVQFLSDCRGIQAALPLLFCHNFCIAWRSCKVKNKN